jgi:hypothetical protein
MFCEICSENTASRISLVYCLSVLMKTIYSIAVIAMFAVIMGMSAIAPAMADRSNGQKSIICHFEAAFFDEDLQMDVEAEWVPINVNNRSLPAHLGDDKHEGHGDLVIESALHDSETTAILCPGLDIPI